MAWAKAPGLWTLPSWAHPSQPLPASPPGSLLAPSAGCLTPPSPHQAQLALLPAISHHHHPLWVKSLLATSVSPVCLTGEGDGAHSSALAREIPMGGGAWWAAVHGVAKGRTRLSDFTYTFHFHALEKAMAPHSSVLAWRIPGTGEPGEMPSMGSHRVGHD